MKINFPVLFSQWDTRWAKVILGLNTDTKFDIYNYGCLITCLAMIAQYYGRSESPQSINQKLKDNDGFVPGSGLYKWGAFAKLFAVEEKRTIADESPLNDSQINEIKAALDKGHPVMVEIDYNPKTVADDQHFVVIVAYNPADENDFTIADPLGGRVRSLKDYLGWFRPNARASIEQYIVFKGTPPANTDMTSVATAEYKKIFSNNQKWSETITGLDLGIPEEVESKKVIDVVEGFKSQATTTRQQLAESQALVENQKKDISSLEGKLTTSEELRKALEINLNNIGGDTKKLVESYTSQIKQWQGKFDQLTEDFGKLNIKATKCDADLKNAQNGGSQSFWQQIGRFWAVLIDFIKKQVGRSR